MSLASLLGLEGFAPSVEVQLLGSVVLAGIAFGTVVLVRRLRRRHSESYAPTLVDLVSSLLIVGTLVAVTLALADLWGHRSTIVEEVGLFQLDEQSPEIVISLFVVVVTQVISDIAARLLADLADNQNVLTQHQREIALRVTQIALWGVAGLVVLGSGVSTSLDCWSVLASWVSSSGSPPGRHSVRSWAGSCSCSHGLSRSVTGSFLRNKAALSRISR
ncbi:hypothetical protein [Halovenus salina]|uniref:Uncharacterized protein n=1 Tax=Halovenus salina TaxID=1510225 RepID=A0ABD5W120_9EURY